MNKAAQIVLGVVSFVVVVYALADVWIALRTGTLGESSRQLFNTALGAIIGIIATTGRGNGPPGSPIGPVQGDVNVNPPAPEN